MAHHKLVLDDDFKEEYTLLAIHCSEEAYKMAYLINKHLRLRLTRERVDLDYSNDGLDVTFPLFSYENSIHYTTYDLVANKCKSMVANIQSSGGLFDNDATDKIITTYLIPEYKKVDFFLKIQSEMETIPLRKILSGINEIKQVISVYELEPENIKSKNNLIFN
jgi:hypothetical protein